MGSIKIVHLSSLNFFSLYCKNSEHYCVQATKSFQDLYENIFRWNTRKNIV